MKDMVYNFDQGHIKFLDGAAGWEVDGKFYPLLEDQLQLLYANGLISAKCMRKTEELRKTWMAAALLKQARTDKLGPDANELAKAREEHGRGKLMVSLENGSYWAT